MADPAGEPISLGLDGSLAGAETRPAPQLSGDGSILAFTSESAALVADDDNGRAQRLRLRPATATTR